jgi:hypothetical protein
MPVQVSNAHRSLAGQMQLEPEHTLAPQPSIINAKVAEARTVPSRMESSSEELACTV